MGAGCAATGAADNAAAAAIRTILFISILSSGSEKLFQPVSLPPSGSRRARAPLRAQARISTPVQPLVRRDGLRASPRISLRAKTRRRALLPRLFPRRTGFCALRATILLAPILLWRRLG